MSLNTRDNKYCCSRCGTGGYSIGLYAKVRGIDNKKAYKELLQMECYSQNKSIDMMNFLYQLLIKMDIFKAYQFI